MTDHLGTLAGLIADLEGLHQPHLDPGDPWCDQEPADWPCPTIELVRKHKRAMYDIESFPFDLESGYRHRVVNLDPRAEGVCFEGTPAECHAWIEAQVNG